jgi:hypothetical protein
MAVPSKPGRYLTVLIAVLATAICATPANAEQSTLRATATAINAEAHVTDLRVRQLRVALGHLCAAHESQRCRATRLRLTRAETKTARLRMILHQTPRETTETNSSVASSAGSGVSSAVVSSPTDASPAPAPPVEEATTPPAVEVLQPRLPGSVILGLVGASGWGPAIAEKVIVAGFKSERFEADNIWMPEEDRISYENGFRDDQVIVGNTPDETKLSAIDTVSWVAKALEEVKEALKYHYTLLEVGNEMYLKGGQSEPARYAEMYMALAGAIKAAGIKGVTLIFNSFGDYQEADGAMSEESSDRGWLGDALSAQPALKAEVQAFSSHPYGIPGVKYDGHDWGIEGLEQQHSYAVALGFDHTDYYATEYGEEDQPPQAPANAQQQAERIKWAYTELLSQPYIKGIWYYQLHDDSSGHWGLVSSSWEPRPALAVMEGLLREDL